MFALAFVLAAALPLPAEIQEHYRDHNFVTAFSTVSERRLVADGSRPADDRLERVRQAMARLERALHDVDPAIMGFRGASEERVARTDVLRVTDFAVDAEAGEAWVELESVNLSPAATRHWIARFDERGAGDAESTVDEFLGAAGDRLVTTSEIHRWRQVDGSWTRERTTLVFLSTRKVR
jgi:hypothetical protein